MRIHTGDDLDTGGVTGLDHVLVLLDGATLGLELITDDLIVCPPLVALDMFCYRVYLNVAVTFSGGDEMWETEERRGNFWAYRRDR